MKFAWIEVRRELAVRLDAPAIVREVLRPSTSS
jgi:hypothetical protein